MLRARSSKSAKSLMPRFRIFSKKYSQKVSVEQVVVDCSNAHNVALQTLHYSEQMGGKFTQPENLNILQDCAELCSLATSFLLRDSKYRQQVIDACFAACRDCARFAGEFEGNKEMQTMHDYAVRASESLKAL